MPSGVISLDPRKHDDRNKSKSEKQDYGARRPLRCAELRQQRCQYLGQQPADDEVGRRYPKYVAALQFTDKGHIASLTNMVVPSRSGFRRTHYDSRIGDGQYPGHDDNQTGGEPYVAPRKQG